MINQIIQGDSLSILQTLPANHVQSCVTSPPYYGLRDYGMSEQIGLEETPEQYIEKLVQVFREVRRVLKPEGTLWLNLGDTYSSGKIGRDDNNEKDRTRMAGAYHSGTGKSINTGDTGKSRKVAGIAPKNLLGIPWRVALALQADGWILRSDIIWHKTNAMPESVKDRPTKSHEYVFLLAKNEKYYYDADNISEKTEYGAKGSSFLSGKTANRNSRNGASSYNYSPTRNSRTVWSIATQPYKDAHFAVMSSKLAERCILAGSMPGSIVLDPFSGAGTTAFISTQLGRNYIGIELNPEYVEMSQKRLLYNSTLLKEV